VALKRSPLENSVRGGGGLQRASPQRAGTPCRFASGGGGWGGRIGAEGRQVGEKAQEKSLVRWAVEVRLQIIEVPNRGGDLRLLGIGRRSFEVSSAQCYVSDVR